MAIRKAEAVWRGNLREGNGRVKVGSGLFDAPYTFRMRFEEEPGTNPEELIAAAHAGCYAMALSADLGRAGFTPTSIHTSATVHLEPVNGAPTITKIELDTVAVVPGMDEEAFLKQAEATKNGCPVSRALAAVPQIVLKAKLQK